ncbi:MAG: VanZ family protein [Chloroflexota bacterium]
MYRVISALAFCFFLFILWIIYLANTGSSSIFFNLVRSIPYGDKLGHVGLFGFLTLLAIVGSKFRSFSYGRLNIYYGAAIVFLFALGEELSQTFIPSRTFDFVDLVANSIGIVVSVGFAYLASKHLTWR